MQRLKVLIAGYEATPFFKKGGLGDVMGSLPQALSSIGVDARVVIPYYRQTKKKYPQKRIGRLTFKFGSDKKRVSIYKGVFPNSSVQIYFLENHKRLNLTNVKVRKIEQYVFFDLAIFHLIRFLRHKEKWIPSLIHCNDWQAALVPVLAKRLDPPIPTLLTIHNLLYQGTGSLRIIDLLGLQESDMTEIKRDCPANELNVLAEGILHATRVSTVSKNYAREIMTNKHNGFIYDIIQKRMRQLKEKKGITGILNGIDYNVWGPAHDQILKIHFDDKTWKENKNLIKQGILNDVKLPMRPTFCFIGRITWQKGLEILIKAMKRLVKLNINIVILGSGNPLIERKLNRASHRFSSHVRTEFFYSEEYAHRLYAGSDFIIIPSRYEPCGLIQMIAMRYGTIPIAAKTGGLADSIQHKKTGLLFKKNSSRSLVHAVRNALRILDSESTHKTMVEAAMHKDFSWDKSAILYKKLYEEMIARV